MAKIVLVLQQGGSTCEWYAHGHDNTKDARDDIKDCKEGAYNTAGPINVPAKLANALLGDGKAEEQFYTLLETVMEKVADIITGR